MPILSDCHMHSSFSADSSASMDDQIGAAIDAGMESICFTEHVDLDSPFANAPDQKFQIDYDAYRETYLRKKVRYAGKIKLLFGLELGINASYAPLLQEYVSQHNNFDFIIGSTHSSFGMDPYFDSFFEGKDPDMVYRHYFIDALANIRAFHDYDSYGHLDYIFRYGPFKANGDLIFRSDGSLASKEIAKQYEGIPSENLLDSPYTRRDSTYLYEKFADVIDPILFELILQGKALEVNTSPLRKGFAEPNPGKAILKKYHDFGGTLITIGSDAHQKEGVAFGFEKTTSLLKECGFTQYAVFEGREAVMHRL